MRSPSLRLCHIGSNCSKTNLEPIIGPSDDELQYGLQDITPAVKHSYSIPNGVPNPVVNIVFVHGLSGKPRETWTEASHNALWPTWLPQERGLNNARILIFGYNVGLLDVSDLKLGDGIAVVASKLKGDLENFYRTNGNDPTLFVAHGLGGLIVKTAMIKAAINGESSPIVRNAKAIIFIATPNHGKDFARVLKDGLSSYRTRKPKQATLRDAGLAIERINQAFADNAKTVKIASIYETTGYRKARSAMTGLPSEISVGLIGNHTEITKYRTNGDPNYVRMNSLIRSLVVEIAKNSDMAKVM